MQILQTLRALLKGPTPEELVSRIDNTNRSPSYRADIDGMRALAILGVLGFHAFPEIFPGGFVGVDLFFVISGFLISQVLLSSMSSAGWSLCNFYARRIKRLFPSMIVVLFSIYIVGWFGLFPDEYKQLGKHVLGGVSFVSNLMLWSESGYFDNSVDTKPLLHLWSLGIEEQFYLTYPVILWLLWKSGLHPLLTAILLTAISFGTNIFQYRSDPIGTFYSPVTRMWEILLGSCIASGQFLLTQRSIQISPSSSSALKRWIASTSSTLGLALVVGAFFLFSGDLPFPGWLAIIPTFGAALLVLSGPDAFINQIILGRRWLIGIGLISFPLYLWHWPLLSLARIFESTTPAPQIRIAALFISFVLAFLTYRFVEAPIRRSRRTRLVVSSLVLASCALGVVGYKTFHSHGFPDRLPQLKSDIDNLRLDYRESCTALTGEPYSDDWCNKGTVERAPTILLLGDSFANAYSSMLQHYASFSPISFKQYARGQCPMLFDYGPSACRKIMQSLLEKTELTQVTTVILALDWTAYIHGKQLFAVSDASPESADTFARSLIKTIDFWQKQGKRVVLFYSPPQGMDPRACVSRPIRITGASRCDISRERAIEHEAGYRKTLANILKDTQGITFFDPFPILCDAQICRTKSDDVILYADIASDWRAPAKTWNHLSIGGGRFLAERAQDELRAVLAH